jgi:hypothetical protein
MAVEVKTVCPLGAKCEEAKDGALHRCAWYTPVTGYDINTGETHKEHWECGMYWLPRLLIENSGMQRQTSENIADFRNEMVKANAVSQQVLLAAVQADQKFIEVQK